MVSGNDGAINVDVFDTAPTSVASKITPVIREVIQEIDRAANAEYVQVTASKVTPKIGSKARNIIYTLGVWLGVAGTVAPFVASVLTGDAANLTASVGSLALALTNLLAKLNLSKTANDLAKEKA
jgi:hypothetical protein